MVRRMLLGTVRSQQRSAAFTAGLQRLLDMRCDESISFLIEMPCGAEIALDVFAEIHLVDLGGRHPPQDFNQVEIGDGACFGFLFQKLAQGILAPIAVFQMQR